MSGTTGHIEISGFTIPICVKHPATAAALASSSSSSNTVRGPASSIHGSTSNNSLTPSSEHPVLFETYNVTTKEHIICRAHRQGLYTLASEMGDESLGIVKLSLEDSYDTIANKIADAAEKDTRRPLTVNKDGATRYFGLKLEGIEVLWAMPGEPGYRIKMMPLKKLKLEALRDVWKLMEVRAWRDSLVVNYSLLNAEEQGHN